jgi:ferredoxin-NADP reductase
MFISIAMPLEDEVRLRPYTIASSPEDGEPYEIVFNRVPGGAGAAWLFAREDEDEIAFTGPFGAFTLDRPPASEAIFIAEGTAIAPIRPMIRRLLEQNANALTHLLYFAEHADHLLYQTELAALAQTHPGFNSTMTVLEGDPQRRWEQITKTVRRRWIEADGDRSRSFYICGVGGGVLELRTVLREAGYERRAIHYERW